MQTLYDQWKTAVSAEERQPAPPPTVKVFTDPAGTTTFDLTRCKGYLHQQLMVFDMMGRTMLITTGNSRIISLTLDNCKTGQMLGYRIVSDDQQIIATGKFIK
jgi:hypothetical protein